MILITQNLVETKEGLLLGSTHAQGIWEGKKKLIVKSCLYKNEINKLLYLLSDSKCYGIIRLRYPSKMSMLDFKKLSEQHLISEEERNRWWPHKEVLFSYSYDLITKYDVPRAVEIPNCNNIFVREFEFLNYQIELIKDIGSYNSSKASNKQLADDWNIAMAWYSTKRSGGRVKHSTDEIINIAGVIHSQITKRVAENSMEYDFAVESMTPLSTELYNLVSNGDTVVKNSQIDSSDGKIVINNFISTSSYVVQPTKPSKCFSKIDEAVEYMFDNGNKFALEKKILGLRVILVKLNEKTSLFSDDGADISKYFPIILAEGSRLSSKSLILDCKITPKEELVRYLGTDNVVDDKKIILHCYDCLFFGEDLAKSPWHERKQDLHSLNFSNHIKEVNSIIVNSVVEATKALNLFRRLQDCDGAMIKFYDGEYKDVHNYAFNELEATTTASPGISKVQGKQFPKKKVPNQKDEVKANVKSA